MSLLKGSVSFIELLVPPSTVFTEDRVPTYAFTDIDDSYDEFSVGWVSPLDMFDAARPMLVLGDYVVMTVRLDQRKVSGALLKKLVAKEERQYKIDNQIPKISRAVRVTIKERIKTELVRKAKPTTGTVDAVWNVTDGRVWFFSTSGSALEVFEELFHQTFGVIPESVELTDTGDFLAWCGWKSDHVNLDGRMTIGEGPEQQVVCAEGPEAFKALALGKQIVQAHILVADRGAGTLSPGTMTFKGFKLPTVAGDGEEGLIMERINLVDALVEIVREEFEFYLTADRSGLQDWILENQGE